MSRGAELQHPTEGPQRAWPVPSPAVCSGTWRAGSCRQARGPQHVTGGLTRASDTCPLPGARGLGRALPAEACVVPSGPGPSFHPRRCPLRGPHQQGRRASLREQASCRCLSPTQAAPVSGALLGLCRAAGPPLTSTTSAQASEPRPWVVAITRRPRARGWTLRGPSGPAPRVPVWDAGTARGSRSQRGPVLHGGAGRGRGGLWGPYFLLSSLARQVAASTALMVAARSPPCSRACSP